MSLRIEARWPRYDGDGKPAPELEALSGVTILRIGTPAGLEVEGGGLAIEYCRHGSREAATIIFGFNELGLWIER